VIKTSLRHSYTISSSKIPHKTYKIVLFSHSFVNNKILTNILHNRQHVDAKKQ